jgi:hypothetical protein
MQAAKQWRSYQLTVDGLLSQMPIEDHILVRYEDLCERPGESAKRIHAFLGVAELNPPSEFDPAAHHILGDGIGGPFSISTTERWRTELPSHEASVAMDIAGDVNRRFGYS